MFYFKEFNAAKENANQIDKLAPKGNDGKLFINILYFFSLKNIFSVTIRSKNCRTSKLKSSFFFL